MNIKNQRIFALLITFILCFTIISPVFVHAVVNYTKTGTAISTVDEWKVETHNGPIYQIQYYYPVLNGKEFKYFIFYQHVLPSVIYFTEDTVFENNDLTKVLQGEAISFTAQQAGNVSSYQETMRKAVTNFLFTGNLTSGPYKVMRHITATGTAINTMMPSGTTSNQYCAVLPSGTEYVVNDKTNGIIDAISKTGAENYYVEWYFQKNGEYPPLSTIIEDDEDVEYMKYPNYLILQQPLQITHGGGVAIKPDEGEDVEIVSNTRGYVETMDDVILTSTDRPYVYVVISSEEPTPNLLGYFGLENLAPALQLLLTDKGHRNDYYWKDHAGYLLKTPDNDNFTRYFFSNLTDACKFVLYGTAGAKYQYKDETHYGYGYTECKYNNYEINYHGINPVPNTQYPLGQMRIILRWHDDNVYEREYMIIDCDYIPYAVTIGTDNYLRISKKLNPKFYQAWKVDEENSDTFNPYLIDNYELIDKYDDNEITRFRIYSDNLNEIYKSTSWEPIYWTHDIFGITESNDNYTPDSLTDTPLLENFTNEDGEWNKNNLTDELFKDGSEKEYTKQPDGTYMNEDGEVVDPSTLIPHRQAWLDSIMENTLALGNVANIINEFTSILDNATEQVKPLTDFFGVAFKSLPTIWKQILYFVILTIILARFLRRR